MPINLAWGIGAAVHFRRTRGTSRPEKVADSPRSKSYASNCLGAMQEGVESERCSQGWLAGSHQASTYAGKYAWSWPRIPAGKSVLGYTLLSACHVLPTWLDCSCVGKWWLRPPTVASMAEATICPWTLLGRRGTTLWFYQTILQRAVHWALTTIVHNFEFGHAFIGLLSIEDFSSFYFTNSSQLWFNLNSFTNCRWNEKNIWS